MNSVASWTGFEARQLRLARRMSVRAFAEHLGITSRMISNWEAGGRNLRPREVNQAALDESLRRCTPLERARFDAATGGLVDDATPYRSPLRWCLVVDLPADDDLAEAIAAAVADAVDRHAGGGLRT